MFYAYNMLVLSKTFLTYLDYVFGDCKFGRNAQSITKTRWMHHSSFIWNYEIRNMAYLKIPARAPKYRMASSFSLLAPLGLFTSTNISSMII
uniref:Uncharacterized protein LOC103409756 n=1 Tax=Rhizophora mucronata TaxID=61149 RepID=A0A2P2KE46_RHIMU